MLTRWNPYVTRDLETTFAALDELRREMDGAFGSAFGQPLLGGRLGVRSTWPRVELFDTGPALVVRAELPGFADSDIDVTLHQGVLTLRGERKDDAPEGYTAHQRERGAASFHRSFSLPTKVNPERTAATLKDGVLTLTMAKAEELQPRQIKVNVK